MADAPVVLCDVLCFVVNKFGKTTFKSLKSALTDFYTSEVLANAKSQLLKDVDSLHLLAKRPHIPSRRDGDGRLDKEVSDIIQLLTFVDENKALGNLPIYASSNPDNMPSLRLYDGDLSVIMRKLSDMSKQVDQFGSSLAAIFHKISDIQVCKTVPAPSRPTAQSGREARHAINNVTFDRPTTAVSFAGNSTETETRPPVVPDWARVASTPCENRFSILAAVDDEAAACDDGYTVVSKQRSNKRLRQQSPTVYQQQQQRPQQRPQQQQNTQKRSLFGTAANVAANRVISAAKKLKKKAVFCIDNVSTSCSVSDIREFVSGLTIDVVSCFEVRPRIRRNEDETNVADRKAFRLCIYEDDRGRLMDAAAWPDSVTVSEWYFKSSSDAADRRQQGNNNNDDNARRPTRPPAPDSSSTPTERAELGSDTDDTVTISAAAAVPAASSNPVGNCGLVDVNIVSDDTIIANYDRPTDIMDTSSIDPNGAC